MIHTDTSAYERQLGDGLILRSVRHHADAERVAAFNGIIHGPSTTPLAYTIMTEHPHTRGRHWLYIEEAATGRIVSSLCLIPWMLRYGEVTLRSGEMGFVGTLDEYRGRGLIRRLDERFRELLREEECDLSHIQGIPYFYRQFGYDYAMPLEAWCRVELHQFGPPDTGSAYHFRLATEADLPVLMRLYDEAGRKLHISMQRDEATWRYLLGPSLHTDTGGATWMIDGPDQTGAGYIRVMPVGFGEGLICGEASLLPADAAAAALSHVAALARELGRPYVRLNLPQQHILVALALAKGAHPYSSYAWQIRLPNPQALLQKLAPVLEQRIAASSYANLTRTVTLNLYRYTLTLHFRAGHIETVEPAPSGQWGDMRLPPQALPQLLLGWRTLEELHHIFPDASANDEARVLMDTLFPRVESFLYSLY